MTSLIQVELFSLKLLAMASSCAFGLKNLLSPQANSNSIPITKPLMKPFQKLEEVSLGSNASLSTLISSPSSPTKFRALLFLSLHSSFPTSKLLSIASYGGELLLDSYSPWSGVSSQLFFFSILLQSDLKNQRTPLMKKIQGLQTPHGAKSLALSKTDVV